MRTFLSIAVLATLFTASLCQDVWGQVLYGSVVGTVTDGGGASVPGARIQIIQAETNLSREATSNVAGYSFTDVPTGTYNLTVSANGFKSYVESGIQVSLNNTLRVDVVLHPGAVTESVVVSAEAATLQTERADIRTDFNSKTLENIPLPGERTYESAFVLIPGVTPPSNYINTVNNPTQALEFSANGTSRSGVDVRVDGISTTNLWIQYLSTYVPPLETIESVNVVTNSNDAEQGLAGGAVVNVQLKSGTNSLHGSAFEYNMNNAMEAKPYFLPAANIKPKFIRNNFGETFGGPIKKDRLFYFLSYEGMIERFGTGIYATIPTPTILSGNMQGSPTPIYDPATGNANGTGRTPFPNNIIPPNRIDPIVTKLISLMPRPTFTNVLANNYYVSTPYGFDSHRADTKIDWNASSQLRASSRFSILDYNENNPPIFGPILAGRGYYNSVAGNGYGTIISNTNSATYTVTPTFLVDGYFGFTQQDTNNVPPGLNTDYGTNVLGIPGSNGATPNYGGMPEFAIANYQSFGITYPPIYYHDNIFQFGGNGTWQKGAHNIKFGVDVHRLEENQWEVSATAFSFNGGSTSLPGGPSPNQYNTAADFLLGLPSSISRTVLNVPSATLRMWETGLYVRDQWQVHKRLSVDYGVRWEYYPIPTRANGGIERFDFNNNTLLLCGVSSVPLNCGIDNNALGFSPSVGLAYRPASTLVFRAGYSLDWLQQSMFRDGIYDYPLESSYSASGPSSYVAEGTLDAGIPPLAVPNTSSSGVIQLPPGTNNFATLPQNVVRGYVQGFNGTIEKQFGGFLLQAAYVGTRTIHQMEYWNINYGLPGGGEASQPYWNSLGISGGLYLLAPLQHMKYNSFQALVQRHFARGYQLNVGWTRSRWMGVCCDDSSDRGLEVVTPQYMYLNYAVMPEDQPSRLTGSAIVELPFGANKRWLTSGPLAWITGGWQVSATAVDFSGLPFSVSASTASLNAPGNPQMANKVKSHVAILHGVGPNAPYFDPLAFASVTTAQFGNAGFDSLRGPGTVDLDMSIFRTFHVWENANLQFRAQALNLTNTPHFANPSANVSNMLLNSDGTIKSLNGYDVITATTGTGREGIDQRYLTIGLRLGF